MYTVLRVFKASGHSAARNVIHLGEEMNRLRPGSFDRHDLPKRGFGVEIEDSPIWWDHLDKMGAFLKLCGGLIKKSGRKGVATQLSVAIWRKDYEAHSALGLPVSSQIMDLMAGCGMSMAFRIYTVGLDHKKHSARSDNAKLRDANRALREGGAFAHWFHKMCEPIEVTRHSYARVLRARKKQLVTRKAHPAKQKRRPGGVAKRRPAMQIREK